MKRPLRPVEHVITRIHIAFVAMCISLLFSLGSAAEINHAGMLVDYGNGTISWVWVPFPEDEITMMDMLERSDLDLITISSGGWGNAICQIEYTGCGPAECRQRLCQNKSSDPFWRLLWLDGETWRMTGTGVDGVKIRDGDVVALSWSAQMPDLPAVSVAEVAAYAEANVSVPPDHAITRTIGDLPDAPEESYGWWPIAGSVGVVLVVAGGLVVRARHLHREAA